MEARPENIPLVTEFVDGELERLGCSVKARMQIDIAIDEIMANISHYAYAPGTGSAEVAFGYAEGERMAEITFRDRGVPFNPLERAEPDTGLSAEQREIGGLGIFLVRRTMDAMEYRHEDGYNVLTIRKRIG